MGKLKHWSIIKELIQGHVSRNSSAFAHQNTLRKAPFLILTKFSNALVHEKEVRDLIKKKKCAGHEASLITIDLRLLEYSSLQNDT